MPCCPATRGIRRPLHPGEPLRQFLDPRLGPAQQYAQTRTARGPRSTSRSPAYSPISNAGASSRTPWSGGGAEFGRTPFSQNKNGRDHNPAGFTTWLAGGGVKPGFAHGSTDELGFRAVADKVHMHDLHATILHLLGLEHERLTFRYAGRDFRLTDVHGRVVREILA